MSWNLLCRTGIKFRVMRYIYLSSSSKFITPALGFFLLQNTCVNKFPEINAWKHVSNGNHPSPGNSPLWEFFVSYRKYMRFVRYLNSLTIKRSLIILMCQKLPVPPNLPILYLNTLVKIILIRAGVAPKWYNPTYSSPTVHLDVSIRWVVHGGVGQVYGTSGFKLWVLWRETWRKVLN